MQDFWKLSAAAIAVLTLAGCNGAGGGAALGPTGPTGTLPVSTKGKMLAVRLPATPATEMNTYTDTPMHSAPITGAVATDRTASAGVGIDGSADEDPAPNKNQGSDIAPAALISASADGTMEGGASFIGLDKAKGGVYFENGNFGDPQAQSADASISAVGVYNVYEGGEFKEQIVLKDSTTIRYRDGKAGDSEANFGVGYVGNPTAAMPTSSVATYKGFYENGIGVYDKGGGAVGTMSLQGDVELTANFTSGKVTGGVSNGKLMAYDNVSHTSVNLNNQITGIAIDATIAGAEYAGSAKLVDATGAQMGTVSHGNAIGGFFGNDAAETIAATSIEGKATLGGVADTDYVIQGVIGAVKK